MITKRPFLFGAFLKPALSAIAFFSLSFLSPVYANGGDEGLSSDNPLRGGASAAADRSPRILRRDTPAFEQNSSSPGKNPPFIRAATLKPGGVLPYGYNLFSAVDASQHRPGVNPAYRIAPGDKVAVNIWGAVAYDSALTVDPQGNIFIPEVGPVSVAGVPADRVNALIENKIRKVYRENVEVYTNLSDRVPISVFVTGAAPAPGRYEGYAGESLVDYLKKAGGPDLERGSFRNIEIKRNGRMIETYDLYDFLKNGALPRHALREGDVVVIRERGDYVTVGGEATDGFAFELKGDETFGAALTEYANPLPGADHVFVSGVRNNENFARYVTLAEFAELELYRGDIVYYEKGAAYNNLSIAVTGWHNGAKRFVTPLDTQLKEALNNIPVNPEIARTDAVYIKRRSVAERQKAALQDSVKRLQETLLLAGASGNANAQPVGQGEIQLLERFITRTESLEPEGRVVVASKGRVIDMALEDGDEIVIPKRSDLVTVNGEVVIPKAAVWQKGLSPEDYISKAGGYTENANESEIIVVRANGETALGHAAIVEPGDEIIVMPEVKVNDLQLAGQITDILYKSVLAVAIPLRF